MVNRKTRKHIEPEELRAHILTISRSYYVSRSEVGDESYVDDEAILEVEGLIEEVSPRHRKHLGLPITICLLSAKRYSPKREPSSAFFGSINLRGMSRSALSYLPAEPFWHVPEMIAGGADCIELRFAPLVRGYAPLSSLWIGKQSDLPGRE
jgi:hypothetical protein